MARVIEVEYNGVTFRRYPDATQRATRVYFTPGPADKQRGIDRLHREVWKAAYGQIPQGAHIHHVDGDPLNNKLENLRCVTPKQHAQEHITPGLTAWRRAHMDAIRPLTKAWHSSEEGLEWHQQHGKNVFANRPATERACEQCDSHYISNGAVSRFCSNACKSAWRRSARLDDVERTCAGCGNVFRVNRYKPNKCCTRACSWAVRRLNSSDPSAPPPREA
jgi:hypothetical protein